MKETIERIIKRIKKQIPPDMNIDEELNIILSQELSTLNPNKIDEERMEKMYNKENITNISYSNSITRMYVDKYNSTLEDHQVLQPLPKDKPDWFEWSLDTSKYDLWDELVKTYGTPTKKELVSVEELEKEIRIAYNKVDSSWKSIAQHIIDTYSLHPNRREWWMDLKEGDKFMKGSEVFTLMRLDSNVRLYTKAQGYFISDECTPCIEPSIHDKVKDKLGIELYQEFMKEVKNG